MNLAGKVVLVTGAARGIGAAISVRLWQEGMFVYAADIDEEALAGAAPAGADERWIPAGVDITDRVRSTGLLPQSACGSASSMDWSTTLRCLTQVS